MFRLGNRVVIAMLATSLALLGADMFSGTWKLNVAKSKYNPGPGPKSTTTVMKMEGDWMTAKGEGVDAAGKATSSNNRYKYDGKEYPYKTAQVDGTISVKKTDDFHAESTTKGGKANVTTKTEISKDGKTRTQTSTGTNAEGKATNNVVVWDKQ